MTTFEVVAAFVGHDLNRGTSAFQRRKAAASPETDAVEGSEQVDAAEPESAVQAA